jgi:hypothetical protein
MGLADIAAELTVTTHQRERGVATVDDTTASLADRLAAYADDLPCAPETAAAVAEAYAAGSTVGGAAAVAETVPVTAAKTLHLLGTPGITPLSPLGRDVLEDYLAGELTRSDAVALVGVSASEFALGAYVATHEPLPGARESVRAVLAGRAAASGDAVDALGDALEAPDALR